LEPIDLQVHVREGHAFDYSDPDEAERYLEASIRGAKDRSIGSEELNRAIRDWTSFYHLTPRRADLLRPLQHLISGDVLEVGGGCGAITRYLGETSRSVIAVEGSLRRARIMAARCQGLSNVTIHCDNFEDFPFEDRRFDAVLCIGVIEYANKFFRAPNGFDRMLARMRDLLSPNGVLLIAIENRLGLKYFAGAPEDHTNQPYEGIEDLYQPDSVLTLGRGEWLRRLDQQGLEPAHWFYPWPDYKTPELIVSEAAFQEPSLDLAKWIRRHAHGRQDDPGAHRFAETLAWPVLVRNGLARELANSFLLVARRAGSSVEVNPPALLWEFDTERPREHASATRITRSGIERDALYPGGVPAPASDLYEKLFEVLNRPGWTVAQIADCLLGEGTPLGQELLSALRAIRSCAEPAADTPLQLSVLVKHLGAEQSYVPMMNEALAPRRRGVKSKREETFTSQVFWKTASSGYSEAASRSAKGSLGSARQTISIALPPLQADELRFDMADRPGIARLHSLCLKAGEGELLWKWSGSAASLQSARRIDASFTNHRGAVIMKLFSQDPNVILPIAAEILAKLEHGATLEMELEWMDPMRYLREQESS
jgi:SAM-dependent methyltransferase